MTQESRDFAAEHRALRRIQATLSARTWWESADLLDAISEELRAIGLDHNAYVPEAGEPFWRYETDSEDEAGEWVEA